MAYQAALLVFKPWTPGDSISDIRIDEAAIWVHLDEVPLNLCEFNLVKPLLSSAGNILCTDKPLQGSIRCSIRVKLQIRVFEPLLPGFFLDLGNSEFKWIHIRYENLFVLCSRCNRVGHKKNACFLPPYMPASFMAEQNGVCKSDVDLDHNLSNSNIGLRKTEKFRTTRVNLQSSLKPIIPPQPRRRQLNKRPLMFATPHPSPAKKQKLHSDSTHIKLAPKYPSHTPTQSTFSSANIPNGKKKIHKIIPNSLYKSTFHPSPFRNFPPVARSPLFFGIKYSNFVNGPFSSQKSYPLKQPKPPPKQSATNSPSLERGSAKQRRPIKKFQSSRLNGKGRGNFSIWDRNKCPAKKRSSTIEPPAFTLLVFRASHQQGCFPCLLPCKKRKGSLALDSQNSSFVGLVASPKAPAGYP